MTGSASKRRDPQRGSLRLAPPLIDTLRALWRGCIERIGGGAAAAEWEMVDARLAELERRVSSA